MSYNDHLLEPLESEYHGGPYKRESIDKIAEAWGQFECAYVEKGFVGNYDGEGYFLTCGMVLACSKTNYGYHIHLFYDGFASLKEKVHTKKDSLTNILANTGWWNNNYSEPNAYQMASFLYIWAGYNENGYCIKLN
jgi:hypothetical protein